MFLFETKMLTFAYLKIRTNTTPSGVCMTMCVFVVLFQIVYEYIKRRHHRLHRRTDQVSIFSFSSLVCFSLLAHFFCSFVRSAFSVISKSIENKTIKSFYIELGCVALHDIEWSRGSHFHTQYDFQYMCKMVCALIFI